MNDIFMILMEHGNPKLAIRYAKRIMKDGAGRTPTEIVPGTKLYELVGELAKYLLEEVQERFASPAWQFILTYPISNGAFRF